MRDTKESGVVRACLDLLRWKGILAWRTNNIPAYDPRRGRFRAFRGVKGISDILFLIAPSGRLGACECKAPGGKLSAHQKNWLDAVREAGGLALVCRDARQLDEALRREGVV